MARETELGMYMKAPFTALDAIKGAFTDLE